MPLVMFFLVERNSSSFSAILLKGTLSFRKSSLKLHLLSLQSLADFVNLVNGASSLADLIHDVLDFIGQSLVF